MTIEIISIKTIDDSLKEQLSNLLIDGVESGASIGFTLPFNRDKSISYWNKINDDLKDDTRILLVAKEQNDDSSNSIIGTIQCSWSNFLSNSTHRCEIQKLIVATNHRGKGISKLLLKEIESYISIKLNKSLLILDTNSDDNVSNHLYTSFGYKLVGTIPFFALNTNNSNSYCSTNIYYKLLNNKGEQIDTL